MCVNMLMRYSVFALLLGVCPLQSWAERNAGEVPDDSEMDEGARAVLEKVQRPGDVRPEVWKDILERYKVKMGRNAKVRFYGKVADQNGLSLEGVKVAGFVRSYDNAYLENFAPGASDQKDHDWTAVTDKNGRFAVSGLSGISLHIRRLEKEGYVAPAYDSELFLISEKHYGNRVHKAQEDKPVVFKMWAKGDAALVADLVRKEIKMYGPADGTEYRVDLAKGIRVENDAGPFDISIKVQSTSYGVTNAGHKYDWSFSLSAVDGGLVATDDPHPFEAPEGGYVSPVTAEYPSANKAWRGSEERKCYVRSRRGALYAMIDVTVYAYRDGKALVRINSVVNTNGSRNLMTLR